MQSSNRCKKRWKWPTFSKSESAAGNQLSIFSKLDCCNSSFIANVFCGRRRSFTLHLLMRLISLLCWMRLKGKIICVAYWSENPKHLSSSKRSATNFQTYQEPSQRSFDRSIQPSFSWERWRQAEDFVWLQDFSSKGCRSHDEKARALLQQLQMRVVRRIPYRQKQRK